VADALAEPWAPYKTNVDPNKLPPSLLIETNRGSFEIELYRDLAPITVLNLTYLADKKLLENFIFGSVRKGEVVQGGDPPSKEIAAKFNWTVPAEFSATKHVRGTVGMRRSPSFINPERRSHPTQFYITLTRYQHLDGMYTVFGQVSSGMNVIEELQQGDKILSIRLPKNYNMGF